MTNSKLNPASEAISMVKAAQTNEEGYSCNSSAGPWRRRTCI